MKLMSMYELDMKISCLKSNCEFEQHLNPMILAHFEFTKEIMEFFVRLIFF